MARANLTLPGGAKVTIDGTPEEVAHLLSTISPGKGGRSRRKGAASRGKKNPPKRKTKSSPQSLIASLADEGYFKSKRTIADIQMKLREQGYVLGQPSLSAPLLRLTKKKTLQRVKEKKGWVYIG